MCLTAQNKCFQLSLPTKLQNFKQGPFKNLSVQSCYAYCNFPPPAKRCWMFVKRCLFITHTMTEGCWVTFKSPNSAFFLSLLVSPCLSQLMLLRKIPRHISCNRDRFTTWQEGAKHFVTEILFFFNG